MPPLSKRRGRKAKTRCKAGKKRFPKKFGFCFDDENVNEPYGTEYTYVKDMRSQLDKYERKAQRRKDKRRGISKRKPNPNKGKELSAEEVKANPALNAAREGSKLYHANNDKIKKEYKGDWLGFMEDFRAGKFD